MIPTHSALTLLGRDEAENFLHRAGLALHEAVSALDARILGSTTSEASIDELADRIAHIQAMIRAVRSRLETLDHEHTLAPESAL